MEFYYIEELCKYSREGDLKSIRRLLVEHKFDNERMREAMVSIYKEWRFLFPIFLFTSMAGRKCLCSLMNGLFEKTRDSGERV